MSADFSLNLDDLKAFRQLHSKCPGHPEFQHTTGVETTTGPLGQGLSNAVGMAMAAKFLGARYGTNEALFDYNVYTVCGDGDLMEGVSSEAASLAGHLKLSNLCIVYDNNHITIEGKTDLAFSENVQMRFESYGFHTFHVRDANDTDALSAAFLAFLEVKDKPTLIILDSIIGYGAPTRANTEKAHGEPLGEEEIRRAKEFLGLPSDQNFYSPDDVKVHFSTLVKTRGKEAYDAWMGRLFAFERRDSKGAQELLQIVTGKLPTDWEGALPVFPPDKKGMATRVSGGKVINALAKNIPWFLGGSADLAPSTKTLLNYDGANSFTPASYDGVNLHFGIREHGMGAIVNGMVLSGLRAYGATFFTFSDYMRPSIRLAAIMEIPSLFIFTHDSIGVGEDGPTHQPIEQLASLRAMHNLYVMRPSDANEVSQCYKKALQIDRAPTAMVLTRQDLPTFDRAVYKSAEGTEKGAYILADANEAKLILIASGSEVHLCIEAHELLKKEGISTRVVSVPCVELFEEQNAAYKHQVLPPSLKKRLLVEQASCFGWHRYLGDEGESITLHSYGLSAPESDLREYFGFTPAAIVARAKKMLA